MKQPSHRLESACGAFEADLVLYYYGDIAPADRRRIEDHCRDCFRCRRFLDDLRGLLPRMAKPKPLPERFWDQYYKETVGKLAAQRARGSWWRELFAPGHVWLIPALGTAAVAVLAVALVLGKSGWNVPGMRPQQEALPQEILADASKVEFFESMDLIESLGVLEKMEGSHQEQNKVQQL